MDVWGENVLVGMNAIPTNHGAADTPLYYPSPYEMEVLRRSEEVIKAGRLYTQEEADKMIEG